MSEAPRLPRNKRYVYRVMWNDDGGMAGHYHPPLSAERFRQIHLGYLRGYPVDTYLYPIAYSGYTTTFPTESRGYAFIIDRLRNAEDFGGHKGLHQYRFVENFRQLWDAGHDPTALLLDEARGLGIDFWLHLRMNDWHHWDAIEEDPKRPGLPVGLNLFSSPFYEEHPEYLIGAEGIAAYHGAKPPAAMRFFQDFRHEEVRESRLEVLVEACERYDIDGFHYDFMRIPGFFPIGREQESAPLMTDLIRRSRAELDRIGSARGRRLGFAVRVPSTVAGARTIGLDVATWIEEGLVDIVVPSCFFCTDLAVDMTEWVEMARDTPVCIHAGLEEAYRGGYPGNSDLFALDYGTTPARQLMPNEMINAVAAKHWAQGVDGIYLFNWACKTGEGNRLPLDNLPDPVRLRYRDKLYPLMRRDGQYEYCDVHGAPLPAHLGAEPLVAQLQIADDPGAAADRVEDCRLWLHLLNASAEDEIEVQLNGHSLACVNPLLPGTMETPVWLRYDPSPEQLREGDNELRISLVARHLPQQVQEAAPIEVADVELEIRYRFPDGFGAATRGFRPRT